MALSALLAARLTNAASELVVQPHEFGFQLAAFTKDEDAVERFVATLTEALRRPVADGEPALTRVAERLAELRSLTFSGAAEAALATCSGELGIAPNTVLPDMSSATGRARLESWRSSIAGVQNTAFAALGAEPVLSAANKAVAKTPAWAGLEAPEDTWPARSSFALDFAPDQRRVSVAFRVASGDAAAHAAAALAAPDASLSVRLRALDAGFRLTRAIATARVRGACLRLDVAPPATESGRGALELSRVISLLEEEARASIASHRGRGALDEQVMRLNDPRAAAAAAAWRTLSGRREPGAERRVIGVTLRHSERAVASELGAALERTSTAASSSSNLEIRSRIESGQGEFWLLLASSCGTSPESLTNAGHAALAVQTLALEPTTGPINFEPWITPDAVGILAHGPRVRADESPNSLAERIAGALGRAIAGARFTGTELTIARQILLDQIGGEPRPGYAQLLEGLMPSHPSWLEARGTWNTLADGTVDGIQARHRALFAGPLRVAILGNQSSTQVDAAVQVLAHWLRPLRAADLRCPTDTAGGARVGEITVSTTAGETAETAYVGVRLPTRAPGTLREAQATVLLLNRPGGLLEQALPRAGNAMARASLVGGGRAAALIIEVRALGTQLRDAVTQVRSMLDRLAQSSSSARELAWAEEELDRSNALGAVDPRRRLVELWRTASQPTGALPPPPPLDPSTLRTVHSTLKSDTHLVVYVRYNNDRSTPQDGTSGAGRGSASKPGGARPPPGSAKPSPAPAPRPSDSRQQPPASR